MQTMLFQPEVEQLARPGAVGHPAHERDPFIPIVVGESVQVFAQGDVVHGSTVATPRAKHKVMS